MKISFPAWFRVIAPMLLVGLLPPGYLHAGAGEWIVLCSRPPSTLLSTPSFPLCSIPPALQTPAYPHMAAPGETGDDDADAQEATRAALLFPFSSCTYHGMEERADPINYGEFEEATLGDDQYLAAWMASSDNPVAPATPDAPQEASMPAGAHPLSPQQLNTLADALTLEDINYLEGLLRQLEPPKPPPTPPLTPEQLAAIAGLMSKRDIEQLEGLLDELEAGASSALGTHVAKKRGPPNDEPA